MSKTLIIGSSNIYKPFDNVMEKDRESINLQRCTKAKIFKVLMEELVQEDNKAVVSVVENFVCDTVGKTTVIAEFESGVNKVVDTLSSKSSRTWLFFYQG